MTALAALRAVALGHATPALLGTCRLEWAGAESYGEEAIRELFRAEPLDPGAAAAVETATGAALFTDDAALIADVYAGQIGRLWRIGAGTPPEAEPAIDVAFDPDLQQTRRGVFARAEDHADLLPAMLPAVIAAGEAVLDAVEPLHRARVFVIRAFSGGAVTVALFVIHRLTAGSVRQSGFAHAAALIADAGTRLVVDHRPGRAWTPRF